MTAYSCKFCTSHKNASGNGMY